MKRRRQHAIVSTLDRAMVEIQKADDFEGNYGAKESVLKDLTTVREALCMDRNEERQRVRHLVNDAIEASVDEHPDFHPHDPDDVKELSRFVRDRLMEQPPWQSR